MTIHKYSGRVYEGTIHFKFTIKKEKKKKRRTQRKSIKNKRKQNKEELAKDRT